MLRRFRLEEPESVSEVSELLSRFGDSAKVYAGGTELLLAMKEGLVEYERLVNIKRLAGLSEVKLEGDTVKIGALCTHQQLENSPVLQAKLPALVKLENNVANVRVRQVGTLGGNICFAEPHADPGTFLIAAGAKMVAEDPPALDACEVRHRVSEIRLSGTAERWRGRRGHVKRRRCGQHGQNRRRLRGTRSKARR
jgi:aerobic carbon-monoxide dehydrogenase medium subunit